MEKEGNQTTTFKDLLERDTTLVEFADLVPELVTESERELLHDNSDWKVGNSLLSLGELAPDPALIDREAFSAIITVDDKGVALPIDEAEVLLSIAIRAGIIKDTDEDDKFMIDKDVHPILERLLDERAID